LQDRLRHALKPTRTNPFILSAIPAVVGLKNVEAKAGLARLQNSSTVLPWLLG